MNLKMSVERLSDSIRELIITEPTIKNRLELGEKLEELLSNAQWAKEWKLQSSDTIQLETVKRILFRFGAQPFEIEALIKAQEDVSAITGAEIRVAVARLRRCGILFAVRKAWGDQLVYLPTDNISLWQHLLAPIEGKPLTHLDPREIKLSSSAFRLPLSLELLSVWFEMDGYPISINAKGQLNCSFVTRMKAQMRLTAEELRSLYLSYPQNDQIPANVALALDIGLCSGILRKMDKEIRICEDGLKEWLKCTPSEADNKLYDLIMTRYCSINPEIHLIASAISTMTASEWYYDDALCEVGSAGAINEWLEILESFGWLERGSINGQAIFRKKIDHVAATRTSAVDAGTIFIQPDGEILVPPEIGLGQRWVLGEIAEKVTADAVFVYRLTRESCIKGFDAGHTLQSMIIFLEQSSQQCLPDPVRRALEDWFFSIGKVKFSEEMLLRTENGAVAALLKQDPEISGKLLEQLGERDFIVDASSIKFLRARLVKLGYPPTDQKLNKVMLEELGEKTAVENRLAEQGFINKRHKLSLFEADRLLPSKDELFPGMSSIPTAWLSSSRAYHWSTSRELMQRAIQWQASVQMEHGGERKTFVPHAIEEEEARWSVLGHWRSVSDFDSKGSGLRPVKIRVEEIDELMIVLPSLAYIETN
ncbi:helicase-associated domain-containing protein [Cohnella abietis]|uniref:Helicase XPB/Ssl2 N-terminal domain-containing protein n=1 Tax=Cohnella abietis TaxID=2507935 RepID=A0A3T1D8X6_9BACL|nr:helicase-associated domain-containing protein [Cohnella abietis]BBI34547.1 hypothetical protein KCTCHS21_39460 [Cohnella abietis]